MKSYANQCERFLTILSDAISLKATEDVAQIDWTQIFEISMVHQLTPLVYFQCKNILPNDIKGNFEKAFSVQVYASINRENEIRVIIHEFKCKSIKYFLFKGEVIANLYPSTYMRTMGDVDIMIKDKDRENVHHIFLNHDFQLISQGETVWTYQKGVVEIEVHTCMFQAKQIHDMLYQNYVDHCWNYEKDNILDWNFHFIYLIIHLRKHFVDSGVGFRQFLDFVFVINKVQLDWDFIIHELLKLELLDFFGICMTLCNKWFGFSIPKEICSYCLEIDEDFYSEATQKIMNNGVFGFDDVSNQKMIYVNALYYGNGIDKFRLLLRRLFPRYVEMKMKYGYLRKFPILLPVAYVQRMIGVFQRDGIKTKISESFPDTSTLDKRIELYSKWGLKKDK